MEKQSNELVREGPTAQDYLIEFVQYLRNRTGFRIDHFRATDELQHTFNTLETWQLPLNIWNAILSGATRLIGMFSNSMNLTVESFVDIFMSTVTLLVMYCTDYFFLKATLFLLNRFALQYVRPIIIALYHFINWAAQKLWQELRLRFEAYAVFTLKELQNERRSQ